MSLRKTFHWNYKYAAKSMAAVVKLEEVAEDLELIDSEYHIDSGSIRTVDNKMVEEPYLELRPQHIPGLALGVRGGDAFMEVTDTTPTLADAARFLLPKVGRWDKSFDDNHNLIRLTGHYKGVAIILVDTPPTTCTVERVEEEVEVPEKVTPAHTEKRVRFVLKGDCDPLMAPSASPESAEPAA